MQVDYERPSSVAGQHARDLEGDEQHRQTRWAHCANIYLGVWLITSPVTFGFTSVAMTWSDCLSGVLVILFASLSLAASRHWARWATSVVGIWLLAAPLVFWAPTAAAYANDILVGSLIVTFSIVIPYALSPPGYALSPPGADAPPGWSYNPSAWLQRAPIVALAFVGFFISRYLAAYQLGHIQDVWDPFFGDGTKTVLESDVSRAFPVSDAGLGAFSYIIDALAGLLGGTRRWRTMPWAVVLFGILIVPPGVVSIVLVIMQPVAVGAWCTLCLAAAAMMLLVVAPAVDEVVATGQFLLQSRREGQPLWRTFWQGGSLRSDTDNAPAPPHHSPLAEFASGLGVTSVPWNLALVTAAGIWLMAAPSVLGIHGRAADSDHLVGALVVTFGVIAMGEIARAARFVNILFGAWLLAAPWLLAGSTSAATWSDMAVGIAVILLSLRRGPVTERYGSWDRYIF